MKKIALVALVLLVKLGGAQTFEKGKITVSLGAGFGLYGTKYKEEYNGLTWNGTAIQEVRVTRDTTDGAASVIYPLMAEYGVTNWLGVGLRGAYAKYYVEKDSLTGQQGRANSIDADLVLNFHLVKTQKRFDMPISVYFGLSTFAMQFDDLAGTRAKDTGTNFGIALLPRIYFTKNIGMYFNVGFASYRYPSLQFSDNTVSDLNSENGKDWEFSISGKGANLGIGLIGKF